MRIEADKESLMKGVSISDSVISSKNVATILTNCHFSVSRDLLEITGTDNEMAIISRVDVVADNEMSFTLNGKRLVSLLKEFPEGSVILDVNDSFSVNLTSKSGSIKGEYIIVGTSGEEFPALPEIDKSNLIELDQSIILEMIKKTIHAAAHDIVKPVFNGIYFVSAGENNLSAVATDSRRLALIDRNIKNDITMDNGVVIPLKTIHELIRLLGQNETCMMSFDNSQCYFKIGTTEVISRIVEGQFPDYTQVIPKDYMLKAVVETKKFRESLSRVRIFTREPSWKILLQFKGDVMTIEANTPDLGEGKEDVQVECDSSEEITIGLNAQFLMDILRDIDAHSVTIGVTGIMSPLTIVPEGDDKYLTVIMPIQVKSS